MTHGRLLRGAVLALALLGLVAPILAGLALTIGAAFGHLPGFQGAVGWADPWRALVAVPGLSHAVILSAFTGLGATAISLALALAVCSTTPGRWLSRVLTPFLAVPHAAMAIGLAFVLAPSGWVARLVAPVAGWVRPPDLATVGDPWGLALILGLVIKEVPFLMLVILAALTQVPVRAHLAAGRGLGRGTGAVWLLAISPMIWPMIRLPVLAVLAYGLSVVDMALILGPSNPPTLAVMLTRLFQSPEAALLLPASAGALVQAGLVLGAFALVLGAERGARYLGLGALRRGWRLGAAMPVLRLLALAAGGLAVLGAMAMVALVLWSMAWRWAWPDIWPQSWSWRAWARPAGGWGPALGATLALAGASTLLALALAIAWLEAEGRRTRARWAEAAIYLPLLVPQIAFLFGLTVVFLRLGLTGGWMAVIWAHALFTFPYVMLALSDAWRAVDPRLMQTAATLGAGRWRRLWRVRLPVLMAPLAAAAAIGVAVSVSQYLPTLFLGAGRIATLTTEAVTLSSSSDRRVLAVFASLQVLVPFAAYALATRVR